MSKPIDVAFEQLKIRAPDAPLDQSRAFDPLTTAALLLKSRALRRDQFQDKRSTIDDMSWHILLDLMVSAAKGKLVTAQDLANRHGLAMSTMSRYVEHLVRIEMIDKNTDHGRTELKLTASGEALTGNALRKIGNEFASL